MKKRFTAILTAVLCLSAPLTTIQANAVDEEVEYTLITDTFSYANNHRYGLQNGFFLKTDLADPDFMVLGMTYYAAEPDKIYGYVVCPINRTEFTGNDGIGIFQHQIIEQELGDIELHVGDFLQVNGDICCTDCYPTYYNFIEEEATLSYLGNGTDIFGEEFEKVIRWQKVIEQADFNERKKLGAFYEIAICDLSQIRGDVNEDDSLTVLDAISINKNLLTGSPLCDYAKIAGDINENSMIDAADSLAVLKEIVGLTENFE